MFKRLESDAICTWLSFQESTTSKKSLKSKTSNSLSLWSQSWERKWLSSGAINVVVSTSQPTHCIDINARSTKDKDLHVHSVNLIVLASIYSRTTLNTRIKNNLCRKFDVVHEHDLGKVFNKLFHNHNTIFLSFKLLFFSLSSQLCFMWDVNLLLRLFILTRISFFYRLGAGSIRWWCRSRDARVSAMLQVLQLPPQS